MARDIAAELAAQPFPVCVKLTPFKILEAREEDGFVRLEFEPQPAFGNHFGNVQGGFAGAYVDNLVSIAVYAKLGVWAPSVEFKTSFVAPMPIGVTIGEAQVLKAGRNLAFVEARIYAGDTLSISASATLLVSAGIRPGN